MFLSYPLLTLQNPIHAGPERRTYVAQQRSPRTPSTPSLAIIGTITSPATGSAPCANGKPRLSGHGKELSRVGEIIYPARNGLGQPTRPKWGRGRVCPDRGTEHYIRNGNAKEWPGRRPGRGRFLMSWGATFDMSAAFDYQRRRCFPLR